MARLKPPVLVTANALAGGEVVYLTEQGSWSPLINEGFVFHALDAAEQARLLHDREETVVGAYLMSVQLTDAVIQGQHYREHFRSRGPTNYWHGKQAEVEDAPV